MKMDKKLNEFGKLFINEVRDTTIHSLDQMISGTMRGTTAQKIKEKFLNLNHEQIEVVKWLIPKIVDINLHNLLFMIDEYDEIELLFKKENLKDISDGLAGELYTEDGWINKFSKERY